MILGRGVKPKARRPELARQRRHESGTLDSFRQCEGGHKTLTVFP